MSRSVLFPSVYDKGQIPGRSKWRNKEVKSWCSDCHCLLVGLKRFKSVTFRSIRFLLWYPPPHGASPQALTRRPGCAPLRRALPRFTEAPSKFTDDRLCSPQSDEADKLNMSDDIWKKRLSDLSRNFFRDKSYFSWPGPCSRGLIAFQGAVAIRSDVSGLRAWACLCACPSECSRKAEARPLIAKRERRSKVVSLQSSLPIILSATVALS